MQHRHPKTRLQLLFAYTGATLSVTLSIALSVLLFWSISENNYYSALFAGLALAFELAKFMALPEIARRKQRKDWMGALSATLLFVTLATASILGSIGGLQSDTQRVQANIAEQEQKRVSLIEQRQLLLDEIAENQKAIDKYIALNRIKNFAQPLQQKNKALRQQAADMQEQINTVGVAHETPMTALLGAIATAVGKDKATVQVYVFILLAVLLDLVASFFIELIREENQFKASLVKKKPQATKMEEGVTPPKPRKPKPKKSVTLEKPKPTPPKLTVVKPEKSDTPVVETTQLELPVESNVINIKRASALEKYAIVKEAVSKLDVGEGVYKRQMMKAFQLGQKTVDKHYRWLMRDGLVVQDTDTKLFYRAA
ncbi:YrzE family protein [Spartinivicinus ruber]|uniref:YrzE family protein n=1 Tax=Spartinivicinus ruber TaxID=2683272 RepID=UPI0013D55222|nr:YrzE family protein [Spartinivicinus ruber]